MASIRAAIFLHSSQCDSNGRDLCGFRAAGIAVVGARGSRNEDAACAVDQCVCSRGAGRHLCVAPQVVHVSVLVMIMHGSGKCVSSGAKGGRYNGVRMAGGLQGSGAVRVRCSDARGAVILSIITA
jgi:hypothetical protein